MELRNKKADDTILSPYMFLMWVIVGAAIVLGVIMFLNGRADVRELEAITLSSKITQCITYDFNYTQVIGNFDVYTKCDLGKNLFENNPRYYFKILLIDGANETLIAEGGAKSYDLDCEPSTQDYSELTQCSIQITEVYGENGEIYLIKVKTASNNV